MAYKKYGSFIALMVMIVIYKIDDEKGREYGHQCCGKLLEKE